MNLPEMQRSNNKSESGNPDQASELKKIKYFSVRLLVIAGCFLVSLFLFLFVADEMVLESDNGFDFKAIHLMSRINSPLLTALMKGITFFGSSYFLLPAYILTILYFRP